MNNKLLISSLSFAVATLSTIQITQNENNYNKVKKTSALNINFEYVENKQKIKKTIISKNVGFYFNWNQMIKIPNGAISIYNDNMGTIMLDTSQSTKLKKEDSLNHSIILYNLVLSDKSTPIKATMNIVLFYNLMRDGKTKASSLDIQYTVINPKNIDLSQELQTPYTFSANLPNIRIK